MKSVTAEEVQTYELKNMMQTFMDNNNTVTFQQLHDALHPLSAVISLMEQISEVSDDVPFIIDWENETVTCPGSWIRKV